MADVPAAIGSILASAGVGTAGTDLFGGEMPDSPDACVVVLEAAGFGPMFTMGASTGAAIRRPRIRVLARAAAFDYAAARTKIDAVIAALGVIRAQTTGGVTFMTILQETEPFPVRYDDSDRPVLEVDFTVWTS